MAIDHLSCPVCGYNCLGKGGKGCIDKPWIARNTNPVIVREGYWDERIEDQTDTGVVFCVIHAYSWITRRVLKLIHGERLLP